MLTFPVFMLHTELVKRRSDILRRSMLPFKVHRTLSSSRIHHELMAKRGVGRGQSGGWRGGRKDEVWLVTFFVLFVNNALPVDKAA